MMKRRKILILSSAITVTVVKLGIAAVTLLSNTAIPMNQKTTDELPRSDRGIRFITTHGRGNVIENIDIEKVEMKNIENQAINFNSYYERGATGKSPLSRNVYINNIRVDGAHTVIEMIDSPEKWLENITINNAKFENVKKGAIAHGVKELFLEDVSITSKGHPIEFDDVFEATIKNVNLFGQHPLLFVGGSESGAIKVEGLNPDHIEYAQNVPRKAVTIGEVKRP